MYAHVIFSVLAPILTAILATAVLSLVSKRWLTLAVAVLAGIGLVGLSGWTIVGIIENGGAKSGYWLPLVITIIGGSVLLTGGVWFIEDRLPWRRESIMPSAETISELKDSAQRQKAETPFVDYGSKIPEV